MISFCSNDCRVLHNVAHRRLPSEYNKTCKICNKEFTTIRHGQVYCSTECRIEGDKQCQLRNQAIYKELKNKYKLNKENKDKPEAPKKKPLDKSWIYEFYVRNGIEPPKEYEFGDSIPNLHPDDIKW
jgi:hypothetical protein